MVRKPYTPEQILNKLRDNSLNQEVLTTLTEAKALIGRWRRECNQVRPHSSLGYRPPAAVFTSTPVETTNRGMVESLTPDPLRIAGPNLNTAPILS